MSRGIIAIGIEQGRRTRRRPLTDGNQIIFLASHDGQAIRFDEADVRPMGRPAYGVRGMDSRDRRLHRRHGDDRQARSAARSRQEEPKEMPRRRRCRKGADSLGHRERLRQAHRRRTNTACKPAAARASSTSRPPSATAKWCRISQVNEKSEVMLISQYGKIIRMDTKNIRESGRSTQGVRLLHLEPGDRVAAASSFRQKKLLKMATATAKADCWCSSQSPEYSQGREQSRPCVLRCPAWTK